MLDREQRILDAAMRYTTLLAGADPISIRDFVATADPDLRDELAAYLERYLVTPQPSEPIAPTPDEQALIDRSTARVQARLQQSSARPQTLSALRRANRLTPIALARQLNLPVDLWQRIERGGVQAATVPPKLIERLAAIFQQTEATIRAALAAPALSAGVQLSAHDATIVAPETAVSFAEALQVSTASDAQKVAWS